MWLLWPVLRKRAVSWPLWLCQSGMARLTLTSQDTSGWDTWILQGDAPLQTRAPTKAAQPICCGDVWRARRRRKLSLSLCLACSPIFSFCNGNQRIVRRRHWQLSAYCLKCGISKALYRVAVMSPELEMNAVEQRLFSILFPLSPLCHSTLLNHPSARQSCHTRCTPLQAVRSQAPTLPSLFDVFSRISVPWVPESTVTEPSTPPSLSPPWLIHKSKTVTSSDINFLCNMTPQ